MTEYEERELERLWIVINAALKNRNSGDSIEVTTTGYEPSASVTIKAYVFEKFIKRQRPTKEGE